LCGASAVPAGGTTQSAPGRLRASCRPALRPVCGVLPLDWDRSGRVTPAPTASVLPPEGGCDRIGVPAASQETWPEVAAWGWDTPLARTVSGTPTGERARSGRVGASRHSVARPAPAGAVSSPASVGVPLPSLSFVRSSVFILPRDSGEGGPHEVRWKGRRR
jgi:hypothetical protein